MNRVAADNNVTALCLACMYICRSTVPCMHAHRQIAKMHYLMDGLNEMLVLEDTFGEGVGSIVVSLDIDLSAYLLLSSWAPATPIKM
jgi:hypothetical protein